MDEVTRKLVDEIGELVASADITPTEGNKSMMTLGVASISAREALGKVIVELQMLVDSADENGVVEISDPEEYTVAQQVFLKWHINIVAGLVDLVIKAAGNED